MAQAISIVELLEAYPDDDSAEKQFIQWRWPDGVACPHCGDMDIQENPPHPDMPFRCRGCHRYFSVKTGSVMRSSKLGYRTWLIAMQRMLANPKGVSSIQLHKVLGISYKSAWFLAHRIRESWSDKQPVFSEVVEVDETFVGGVEKNKHALKRDRSGSRGWNSKTIFGGPRERSPASSLRHRYPARTRNPSRPSCMTTRTKTPSCTRTNTAAMTPFGATAMPSGTASGNTWSRARSTPTGSSHFGLRSSDRGRARSSSGAGSTAAGTSMSAVAVSICAAWSPWPRCARSYGVWMVNA